VAYDFRTADVAAGGEGAPLAPIYHLARAQASGLEPPLAVLNIGGVANVTFWTGGDDIAAFDTGPGNGMIDLLVQARAPAASTTRAAYASVGRSTRACSAACSAHPYFQARRPSRWTASTSRWSRWPSSSWRTPPRPGGVHGRGRAAGFEMMGAPAELIVCGGGGTIRRS
jgi:anhydro-N-acetylmuramic acid kinase